jgi:hypothetical protein
MEQLSNGQFGPLYDELHPAQQAVIDKSGFMQCAAKAVVGEFKVTKIKDQYAEKVDIPGTDVKGVDSVALTAEVRSGTDTDTLTLHEIEVDGEWLWVVTSPADHDPATC